MDYDSSRDKDNDTCQVAATETKGHRVERRVKKSRYDAKKICNFLILWPGLPRSLRQRPSLWPSSYHIS
jgi:uncharacterized alpha-E superfamily protein